MQLNEYTYWSVLIAKLHELQTGSCSKVMIDAGLTSETVARVTVNYDEGFHIEAPVLMRNAVPVYPVDWTEAETNAWEAFRVSLGLLTDPHPRHYPLTNQPLVGFSRLESALPQTLQT